MPAPRPVNQNASPLAFTLAGVAIVGVSYGLARYTYGLFVPEIGRAFELGPLALGAMASASYGAYLAATIFGSTASAVLGPRLPVVIGGLAATTGMTLIALAPNVWILAIGVVIAGASPGLCYPPLSDAVMLLVSPSRQNRVYAIINSGTSLGVTVSGPAAILAGESWRAAWLAFAVAALLATLWNMILLPSRANGVCGRPPRLTPAFLMRREAYPLFAGAAVFGVTTSVFWTFAVDLVVSGGGLSADAGRAFWILIGIAGFGGALAGDLVDRHGLARVLVAANVVLALATATLASIPWHGPSVLASGAAFGATFILATGLYGIWSVNLFNDRPAAGFGATFFLISAGQLVGPTAAGALAAAVSLEAAFYAAAAIGLAGTALRPSSDIRAMTRRRGDASR